MQQRLRVKFSRGEELKYISHLDIMKLWERAFRRAETPLFYSEGFSPHPKISLAVPLSVGMTSEGELMDVFLERRVSPYFFIKTVSSKLPRGIEISEVKEVWLRFPSLQSQVRYAEYRVEMESERDLSEVKFAIKTLLEKEHLPWQHKRDKEVRKYDLRSLIASIGILDYQDTEFNLGMRLYTDSKRGTGRPEQVTLALGFPEPPKSIHRTELILAGRDGSSSEKMLNSVKHVDAPHRVY